MASSSGLGHSSAKSAWVFQTQARSLPAFGFSSIIGVTGEEEPCESLVNCGKANWPQRPWLPAQGPKQRNPGWGPPTRPK